MWLAGQQTLHSSRDLRSSLHTQLSSRTSYKSIIIATRSWEHLLLVIIMHDHWGLSALSLLRIGPHIYFEHLATHSCLYPLISTHTEREYSQKG